MKNIMSKNKLHIILALCLLCLFVLFTVHGQIGVTTCTFATQALCAANIPLSYCDVGAGRCTCATVAGYVDDGTGLACIYYCGSLNNPINGVVTTQSGTTAGKVAVYSCYDGYKINGTGTRTCLQDSGWSSAAPLCNRGVLGDNCSANSRVCSLILFGTCNASHCVCKAGYEDDGTGQNCTDINECISTPCRNGGQCVDGINSYMCVCKAGFMGMSCDSNIDECASTPCQNGGQCFDGNNSYVCVCAPCFTGTTCDSNMDECASTPCHNGGQCFDGNNSYACVCAAGFTGTTCDSNIDECASRPCQNGGKCVDGNNSYTCDCEEGFTGISCYSNINECISAPCHNGGQCIDGNNSYICACTAGFSGISCDSNFQERIIIAIIISSSIIIIVVITASVIIGCLLVRRFKLNDYIEQRTRARERGADTSGRIGTATSQYETLDQTTMENRV